VRPIATQRTTRSSQTSTPLVRSPSGEDVKDVKEKDTVDENLDLATAKVADVVSPSAAARLRRGR
jgi:hypothetical protein